MQRFLTGLPFVFLPSIALAHTGVGSTTGVLHGFEHPLGGLDHILAMVAVGVFAFLLGGRALWLVPSAFVAMMIVGFILGVADMGIPFVELGIALSSVVIGGAVALNLSMPVSVAMTLVGTFAIFHGHAHGAEMPETTEGLTYALGFSAATALLHGVGIALAQGVSTIVGQQGRMTARVTGGALALGGVGILFGWV